MSAVPGTGVVVFERASYGCSLLFDDCYFFSFHVNIMNGLRAGGASGDMAQEQGTNMAVIAEENVQYGSAVAEFSKALEVVSHCYGRCCIRYKLSIMIAHAKMMCFP